MKLFNWVHRKFNNKVENVKKNEDDIGGVQEQNKSNHVFERWRGGILAIGTLGYDPLKDENPQLNDYFYDDDVKEYYDDDESSEDFDEEEEEEEEAESGDEEVNPSVVSAYSYNADECGGSTETETETEENWKHDFEYVMMKKKERTTLADLFYADSHDHDDVIEKKQPMSKADLMKEKSNRKQHLLFRNKLMAKDARPIHKLNQLMRRMLKRKIHPEVGTINSKVATRKTDDYASLLPTQDGNNI